MAMFKDDLPVDHVLVKALNKLKEAKLYTRPDYLRDFKENCDASLDLTARKNNDYGGVTDPFKNFREFGELGILVRMSDKFARLKTALFEKRELAVTEESIDDTIMDLMTYSNILLCWRKAHKNDRP